MRRLCATIVLGLAIVLLMAACQSGPVSANSIAAHTPSGAPAPELTTSPTVAAAGMTIVHTVQPGETLYRIARLYGTSVEAISRANHITDPRLIRVGQKLTIPPIQATTEPEPTDTPTPTMTPTRTPVPPSPTPTAVPPTPASTRPTSAAYTGPPPDNVNGIQIDRFVIMPPAVQENVRQIFAKGQSLGADAHRFTRIGDSIIEHPHFMVRFDTTEYQLGQYAYLQPVLDYYHGSFGHDSLAVRRGLHAWSVLNPTWADKTQCQPEEGPVACEFRSFKPSMTFIVIGSNDVGAPAYFRKSMEAIVQYCIDNGVIPVIVTKADRNEGPDNINNIIMEDTAAKFNVPLLDFDAVAATLPNRGIDPTDGIHLTFYYAHDYTVPIAFTKGHAIQDLTAVILLDRLWRTLGLNQ
jgi:LysM repeat protein